MFTFSRSRKVSVEKTVRSCMAYIQVLFVQRIIEIAKKQGNDEKEVGGIALFYGIAYFFLELEKFQIEGTLEKSEVLSLKEETIRANLRFGFKKKELTAETLELLAQGIYEVLGSLKCDGITDERILVNKMISSFCEMSGMEEDTKLVSAIWDMSEKIQQFF